MNRIQAGVAAAVALLAVGAAAQAAKPVPEMSFFITSAGPGKGADLGGLAGADRHCQQLAAAAGAGKKRWRAYLSATAAGGAKAVNARDRIGKGPWYSFEGRLVARNVDELHTLNGINRMTALTEKGENVNGRADAPNMHDILNNIRAPYEDALRGFLKGTGEEALQRAYDLGRRAAEDGVGTLDMVKLHEEVLHTILKDSQRSEALADTVRRASQFFAESLSPYEMTHRGFQEALQTLRVRADELADMNRMLEDEISERTEVERALRESENRFRTLVETARDVIFTLSLHGRITSMNPAFEDLVGAQRTEWIDRSCVTLLHTDDTPRAIRVFQQVLRGEIPATFEARIRTNRGTYLVGEFIMAPQQSFRPDIAAP